MVASRARAGVPAEHPGPAHVAQSDRALARLEGRQRHAGNAPARCAHGQAVVAVGIGLKQAVRPAGRRHLVHCQRNPYKAIGIARRISAANVIRPTLVLVRGYQSATSCTLRF